MADVLYKIPVILMVYSQILFLCIVWCTSPLHDNEGFNIQ